MPAREGEEKEMRWGDGGEEGDGKKMGGDIKEELGGWGGRQN